MKRYSDSIISPSYFTSQNVSNLMDDTRAEQLLRSAAYYVDARDASSSGQIINNLGTAKELLPTTLGSSTSADSNDPKFLEHTGTNYVYLPGIASNFLSAPDSNDLDITGDIDIRWYGILDDWSPSGGQALISKYGSASSRSFYLRVDYDSKLTLLWTTDGTTGTLNNATSSVVTGISDNTAKWVRVTLDVDNGASGRDIKFYTSDDGVTWTQLGTTVTQAGTTSIFAGTEPLRIGTIDTSNLFLAGKIFRAQIFNGINGTKVFDLDTSVLKTGSETSFTALTGQTVTVNRSTSGRKTAIVTQPCWLFGSDDYMEVNNRWIDGTTPNLYLPGVSTNYAYSLDATALDITGDIDLRVKVALEDWTPSSTQALFAKMDGVSNRSWLMMIDASGILQLFWSVDGTNQLYAGSSVVTGISDNTAKWVRVTLDVDNGSSGNTVTFYTSNDGILWTQLGNAITASGTTSLYNSTSRVEVGSRLNGSASLARGRFYRAQIFNGIDGTKVFDADFENKITSLEQTSFIESSSNAATVTINRSGTAYKSAGITKSGYLYPGSINKFKESSTSLLDFAKNEPFSIIYACRAFSGTGTGTVVAKSDAYGGTLGYISVFAASSFMYQNSFQNWPTYFYYYSEGIVLNGNLAVNTIVREPFGTGNTGMGSTSSVINYSNGGSGSYTTTAGNSAGDVNETITNNYTFKLGTSNNMANLFDGEIYAVAIFRRALTQQETNIIYNYFNRRSL